MTDTQSLVNRTAWAACDTFRGVVDAGQYKDYILVMLFLKYISDLWDDHAREYRKRYGDNEARIRRRLSRERFVLPEGASFRDLHERRSEANIGELINIALERIEDANRAKLEGVFRNIDFNSEANLGQTRDRNRRLKNLLEDFAKPALDLRPSRIEGDVIGECYIYLISRFASDAGKKAGEFYTPSAVSGLLASLAAPREGDTICDPACGSGSLLIKAAQEVGSRNFALYGQEVNGATWALARMNLFLHGMDAARIVWCNTLTAPVLLDGDRLLTFDVVVANPPFSLKKWGAENAGSDPHGRFWRGVPPPSKGDYAFITHMIETAKRRRGRVAVIVPHGVLFRGASGGTHPQGAGRGEPAGRGDRAAAQAVHDDGDPGGDHDFRPRARGGRRERRSAGRALHRREPRVHAGQEAERAGEGAHREDRGDLPRAGRRRTVLAHGRPRRDRGERLQPEHPQVRGHLRARGAGGHRRGAARDRENRGRAGRGAGEDDGVSEGAGGGVVRGISLICPIMLPLSDIVCPINRLLTGVAVLGPLSVGGQDWC